MAGIFKEYDIRGIYPDELNEDVAYRVGRSAAKYLKSKVLVVGRDGRLSSPQLANSLINGILDEGVDVIDIGLVATPIHYHSLAVLHHPGIMVTASHNPKEYNGFKLVHRNEMPLVYEKGLKAIEKIYTFLEIEDGKKKGKTTKREVIGEYLEYLQKKFKGVDFGKLKIIIDFSNGTGAVAEEIFDGLGIENIKMYDDIDGNFPHGCNPMIRENVVDLQNAVLKHAADVGVIYDGDADRVIFVDEKGAILTTDMIFILLAKEELKKKKGNCYFDLRFSRVVEEEIRKSGGTPVLMRVGNPFDKIALKNRGGVIAAELSGHIMYKENFDIDDSIYATLKLLKILSKSKKKLSELIAPHRKYFQSDEINVSVEDKDAVLKKFEDKYRSDKRLRIKKLDGISVYAPDYVFNVRKSQTEPLIRIKIEADTREKLEEVTKQVMSDIQ